MLNAAFVSCDIVGHSAEKDIETQRRRISAINSIVADSLGEHPADAFWASGGDGGHVLFCHEDWQAAAFRLLARLGEWSRDNRVPLRLIGHYGPVDRIAGADGRVQFLGDGINFAGRLLDAGASTGIVVSAAFKSECERAAGETPVEFHSARFVFLKTFGPQAVQLLSLSAIRSAWPGAADDRTALLEAADGSSAWQVLYRAKRIMQGNAFDEAAEEMLECVGPHQLTYASVSEDSHAQTVANPFLAPLDPDGRTEVIRRAQLVERRQGEHICDAGDPGDSMFVVLRGEVGVFLGAEARGGSGTLQPVAVVRQGEIVGELALALRRPRTATLIAIEDAALLSLNSDSLRPLLQSHPEVEASLDRFVTSRILEFACRNCSLLLGPDGTGPLSALPTKKPWERLLRHAEQIRCPPGDASPISLSAARFDKEGLYLLVAGRLRSVAYPAKVLAGGNLPLLFVDLPGFMSLPDHEYRTEDAGAKILRISKEAFVGRTPVIDRLARALISQLAGRDFFHLDVFLSYTFDDFEIAKRWRQALEGAGLRVYMEEARTGHYFKDRIEAAILESLTLVALVSAQTMSRPLADNWVRQEISFRTAAFELKTARIFPVRLPGGKPELLADGYTLIDAVNREEQAIAQLIDGIGAVKRGAIEPPYSLTRKSGLHLGV